jgi:uncharacterized membrane protein
MECEHISEVLGAVSVVGIFLYFMVRDFIFRKEDADRRELWALREKYKPGFIQEEQDKARLVELEKRYL